MMQHTMVQALARVHLAELHRQAQRDALARAARRARRQPGRSVPRILAAVTVWARRTSPAPESP